MFASLLFLFLSSAHAATVEEVCSFDKYCSRLIGSDRKVIPPSPEMVAAVRELAPFIRETAKRYEIAPEAIAGAIMAENTMNIRKGRTAIKELIASMRPLQNAYRAVWGHTPSIGLGGVQLETAFEVEQLAAQREGRAPRKPEQIDAMLRDPKESIIYSAAIMKRALDLYKNAGHDISHPSLLATVFNLGDIPKRLRELKEEKRAPKINYFGLFVQENMKAIEEATRHQPVVATTPKDFAPTFTRDVPLLPYPPNCDPDVNSKTYVGPIREYQRTILMSKPSSIAQASGPYQILQEGLDCDMKTWSLVATNDGKMGWVSQDQLRAESVDKPVDTKKECKPSDTKDCISQISGSVQSDNVIGENQLGLLDLKLARAKDSRGEVNFRDWSPRCLERSGAPPPTSGGRGRGPKDSGSAKVRPSWAHSDWEPGAKCYTNFDWDGSQCVPQAGTIAVGFHQVDPKGQADFLQALDQKEKEFLKAFNVKKLSEISESLGNSFKDVRDMDRYDCRIVRCYIDQKVLADFLNTDLSKVSSHDEILSLTNDLDRMFMMMTSGQQAATMVLREAVDAVTKDCASVFQFSGLEDKWKDVLDAMKDSKLDQVQVPDPDDLRKKCQFLAKEVVEPLSQGLPCTSASLSLATEGRAILAKLMQRPDDQRVLLGPGLEAIESFVELAKIQPRAAVPGSRMRKLNIEEAEGRGCAYDPMATLELAKKALSNPCVESVIVPDMFIVKSLNLEGGGRVLHGNATQGDRFQVKVRGACAKAP